jgi:hypothetical protein
MQTGKRIRLKLKAGRDEKIIVVVQKTLERGISDVDARALRYIDRDRASLLTSAAHL